MDGWSVVVVEGIDRYFSLMTFRWCTVCVFLWRRTGGLLTALLDSRKVQMFGTLYMWKTLFSVRIIDKNLSACLTFTLSSLYPDTEADICKHMLICLASYTFLCWTPKLLGPQLDPESSYMLYTWLILLQISLRKHLTCRADHPRLLLTAKYQLAGGPLRYAVGNKSWTLIFCSSL